MGSRRVNISIIVLVLALLAGSFYVIFTKPTKLGLDLSGGTQRSTKTTSTG
jgi:preprotein translocase subunit SecF